MRDIDDPGIRTDSEDDAFHNTGEMVGEAEVGGEGDDLVHSLQ